MDITRQYNQIGKDYIEGKSSFFSEREDWGSKTLLAEMGQIKGLNLLDMGCGDGSDSLIYLNQGATVTAIDPSSYMVEQAKKNLGNKAKVFLGDYYNIPVEAASIDILVGRYSFHYLNDFNRAYAEISRVLKPGGVFLILVPNPMGDLFMKKEKNDDGQEIVAVPLYGGKVTVRYLVHSISQYFSPEFFKLFKLASYSEFVQAETDPNIKVPTAMVIKAIKI